MKARLIPVKTISQR